MLLRGGSDGDSPSQPASVAAALPGWSDGCDPAFDPKLEVEGCVERLEHALDHVVASCNDPGHRQLVRELFARRQVDACDFEERDVVGARVDSCAGRLDEPGNDRRPKDLLVGRHRIPKANRVGVRIRPNEAPGVRLGDARADEDVFDDAAEPLLFRRRPRTCRRSGIVCGIRSSTGRATSSITSISRVTSRARQVGTVTSQSFETSKPKPSRVALLVRGNAEPDHERRPLGAKTDDGPFGKPVVDVDVAGHPRAREIDDHPAREDRRVLREVRVDALLPAVGTGCPEPESLGRAENPERLEVRREQELVRALRDLALLASPPSRRARPNARRP